MYKSLKTMENQRALFANASEFEIVNPELSKRQDSLASFDDIAQILLQENFILTALEFHAELLENGLELPRLRDYFSNPGNFERAVDAKIDSGHGLPRTSSIQTLDSLDFARYSDDGDRQINDKLAVLEFELRKAQETIKSLRANLTEAAESDGTVDNCPELIAEDDAIKLHERRSIDYLVNEYLLKNNYKLTSITFSDENSNQDFEDWDDVGLNIPKPPTLLSLYREYGRNSKCGVTQTDVEVQVKCRMKDKCVMVDDTLNEQSCKSCRLRENLEDNQLSIRARPTAKFKKMLPDESHLNEQELEKISSSPYEIVEEDSVNETIIISHTSVNSSKLHSSRSNLCEDNLEDSNTVLKENLPENINQPISSNLTENVAAELKSYRLQHVTLFHKLLKDLISKRNIMTDNRLAAEINKDVDSSEKLIFLLTRCLPHIVPNVILSKREELLPVILCAINLHPDVSERDKLLNLLFNLIKRPDEDQRQMILSGFVAIAQLLGTNRVENELLPQCWEQIGHKYPERRILVAEACGVLIPYITDEMKSSLVLSMLQQMLHEEKIDVVRSSIVQSLAVLFAHMQDVTKYSMGMNLLSCVLHDSSDKVSKSALRLLLPTFCLWSKKLTKLQTFLVPEILRQINESLHKSSMVNVVEGQHIFVHFIEALLTVLPWILVIVIEATPSETDIYSLTPVDIEVDRVPPFISPLCNLSVIIGDSLKCSSMLKTYELYTSEEWYESWSLLDWVIKSFLPDLFVLLKKDYSFTPEQSHSLCQLFFWFNRMFGRHFMMKHVKPCFKSIIKFHDHDKETIQTRISTLQILIPVYACGVLAAFPLEEDRQELVQFLNEVLVMLSLCRLPLTSIELTITELKSNSGYDDVVLSVLWDCVVHSSPLVRASAAVLFQLMIGKVDEHILATKIAPALITLANDPEIIVKISTVQTFGCILEKSTNKELLAKAEMLFQTFLDDPMYKDQYELRKEIIQTLGQVAPISDLRFREEFVLPHLVALANCNNQLHHETKRTEIALAILDAFIAMSGFCTNEKIINELVIPGLKCLLYDIQQLAPVHEDVVYSLINEFNSKLPTTSAQERTSMGVTAVVSSSVDEVKSRVGKIFTHRTMGRSNIQNIFSSRKNN